ncbi:hypothetical protein [Nocardioides jishulii]|uniref:WD40 repeat domain-containing protein n=1 Tax=Nocardioides jishulii TaxID=2575440 RepID=A0A4U2YIA9_9ACTN|nr:hypothetical protein [Nocardioides jishulii]QCX27957.1 hypothetical protein FCL41_10855 [Nocardioides jishulii]TKI60620.1 hypothetical protein FC770_13930 [Nocardioides jishulii]
MNAFGGISGRVLGAAVVSLSLGVGLVPGSAAARGTGQDGAAAPPPVRTVNPAKLRRGPDAAIPYLQDGWIHSGGKRVRVRVPHERGRQVLLGRSGSAWVVASWRNARLRVHRIRSGQAPTRVPGLASRGGALLSRGGAQIVLTYFDRGGGNVFVHRMSDGKKVDSNFTGLNWQPFDAADGHVLLHRDDEEPPWEPFAADWVPGGGDRRLGTGMNAGFLRQDVVFVEAARASRAHGPTSISSPGTPAWTADFTALAVSPDGQLVIGTGPRLVRKRAVLQVRRMSDGVVLQQFSYGRVFPPGEGWGPSAADQTVRFETDTRFVFQFSAGGRSRLVRCATSGRCARASDTGGGITTSFERFMWRW